MKINILVILFSVSLLSCGKEIPTVKHVRNTKPLLDLKNVTVINPKDPICGMNTAKYLADTVIYKGNSYGFCSESCKSTFKKNPEKYVQNGK